MELNSAQLRFLWIPNQLSKDGRIEKFFGYENGKPLSFYLDQTGFDYKQKDIVLLSSASGRVTDPVTYFPVAGEEVLVMHEMKDPFTIGAVILASLGASIATVATYATVVGWIAILATVAVVGFTIFSAFQKPKTPSYGTFGGTMGSMEESSPTYGWDGVRTIMDVGVPIGVLYGTHKIGGNIINQYVYNDGEKEYLNLLIGLCEGEIESISDIKINDNPYENFSGLTKYERYGTNDQTVVEGFEELHSVTDVGANLLKDAPYTQTTVDSDVEAFEVEVSFPYGLYEITNGGDLLTLEAEFQVSYKSHTGEAWTDLPVRTVSANSRTNVKRKEKVTGLTPDQYDVKVTKISDNSTSFKISDMKFNRLDEIKNDDLAYPNTALLGLKLLATDQLSGITPQVSCIVKGKKIKTYKVMNGDDEVAYDDYYYDPDDDTFKLFEDDTALTWDEETYTTAWSANPVWCLYDLLTNARYGLGEFIDATNIDLDQFVDMAKYCDEKLPKADGSYEKRFQMDCVIDASHGAVDILLQLCATFRAWAFYSQGAIKLKIDKPETPVQLFGMGNIIEGTFQQAWKSVKEVPNVIEVQFLNANQNYEQEIVAVTDETSLATEPMRKKSLRIFTTSMSRALREGRYALNLAKYIHRSISFRASIDAIACQSGDVISVSHDLPAWGSSGRVVSGSISAVVLDKQVTIVGGTSYKIRVKHADDTVEEKTVTNSAGTTATITISGTWTQNPASGDVWSFGETSLLKKDFRIINVKRENNSEIAIECAEYNANVYDDTAPTEGENNLDDPTAGIPSVTDLALTERIVKLTDGTIENVLDVWWNKPDLSNYPINVYDYAKVYISDDGGDTYTYRGLSYGGSFAIDSGIQTGSTYKVVVATVTKTGIEKSLALCPSASISILGKEAPPSNVTGFAVSFASDHLHFTWNHIADVDLAGYEIRELPASGASWGLGTPISVMISENQFDYFSMSVSGNRYFAIKAIDTSGNYSTNATNTNLFFSAIPEINVIEEYDFDLNNGTLSGDAERAMTKDYSTDYYKTALRIGTEETWDEVNTSETWDIPTVTTSGVYITETVDLDGAVDAFVTLAVGVNNTQGGQISVEIAYSDDDDEPVNWTTYANGQYSGRYFRFRVTFSTTDVNYPITIYKLKAIFDVPDVDEYGIAVEIAGTGWTTIEFTKTFLDVKALVVSVVGNPYILEMDQTNLPASFNVKLKDSAGSQQAGYVNWYAKGY